jgi:hypothetical protein
MLRWSLNWKGLGRKRLWPNHRTFLEWLGKIHEELQDSWSPGRGSNRAPLYSIVTFQSNCFRHVLSVCDVREPVDPTILVPHAYEGWVPPPSHVSHTAPSHWRGWVLSMQENRKSALRSLRHVMAILDDSPHENIDLNIWRMLKK